jgi:5'-3' exonuclease
MGIGNFYKIFGDCGEPITLKSLSNKNIAIDASIVIYAHGTSAAALTDKDGNPTGHLDGVLTKAMSFFNNNINQIWVFDGGEKPLLKLKELERRKEGKMKVEHEISELTNVLNDVDVSVGDEYSMDINDETTSTTTLPSMNPDVIKARIENLKKRTFRITGNMVDDIITMLSYLGFVSCSTIGGYEAEHLCAQLTSEGIVDAVWSQDSDVFAFGGTCLVRYVGNGKNRQLTEYKQLHMFKKNNIDMEDMRKICVIMGCDYAKKTYGVGPMSIFKKYEDIVLTDTQNAAVECFKDVCPKPPLRKVTKDKIKFLDFMEAKGFNRARLEKKTAGLYSV